MEKCIRHLSSVSFPLTIYEFVNSSISPTLTIFPKHRVGAVLTSSATKKRQHAGGSRSLVLPLYLTIVFSSSLSLFPFLSDTMYDPSVWRCDESVRRMVEKQGSKTNKNIFKISVPVSKYASAQSILSGLRAQHKRNEERQKHCFLHSFGTWDASHRASGRQPLPPVVPPRGSTNFLDATLRFGVNKKTRCD